MGGEVDSDNQQVTLNEMSMFKYLFCYLIVFAMMMPLSVKAQKDTVKGYGISSNPEIAKKIALYDALKKVEPMLGNTMFCSYTKYYEQNDDDDWGTSEIKMICALPSHKWYSVQLFYKKVNCVVQLIENKYHVDIDIEYLIETYSTYSKSDAYKFVQTSKK